MFSKKRLIYLSLFIIILLPIKFFVADFYIIPSNNLLPNHSKNDPILALKIVGKIQKGDVVLYRRKSKDKVYRSIGRVFGTAGDTIWFGYNRVFINDKLIDQKVIFKKNGVVIFKEKLNKITYQIQKNITQSSTFPSFTYNVPKGEIFILGDSRDQSVDSRHHGTIKIENVYAKKW